MPTRLSALLVVLSAFVFLSASARAQDPGRGSRTPEQGAPAAGQSVDAQPNRAETQDQAEKEPATTAAESKPNGSSEQPAAPAIRGSEFRFVDDKDVFAEAMKFVESKGWQVGWYEERGWGVYIGQFELISPNPTGLAMSMHAGCLQAKFEFAVQLGGRIEASSLAYNERSPGEREEIVRKLETRQRESGPDPVSQGIVEILRGVGAEGGTNSPDKDTAYRRGAVRVSRTVAQSAIPGMAVAATFVETTDAGGLEGKAAVVLVSTPRTRQLADAMLEKLTAAQAAELKTGAAGQALKDLVRGYSEEQLVYTTGATYAIDERGNYCVLGFGVDEITDGDEQSAIDFATQFADAEIRVIAGELVVGSRMAARMSEKVKLKSGESESESLSAVSSSIMTIADGLTLPGITTVDQRTIEHPKLGALRIVIRSWNLGRSEAMARLREVFKMQAGYRGGEGVTAPRNEQPAGRGGSDATSPRKPNRPAGGVPSGRGGGGIPEE